MAPSSGGFRRAGIGRLDRLFHDARQRLLRKRRRRRPPMAGGRVRHPRRRPPDSRSSRSAKCVKTCSTGAGSRAIAANGAVSRRVAGLAPIAAGHFAHAAEQPFAAGVDAAGSRRRRGARRRRCRSGSAARASPPSPGAPAAGPRAARGMARTRGRARRRASSACRWWRRDPSAPRRTRRRGRAGRAAAACRGSPAFAAGSGASMAKSRAITRSTLPSTTATGSSKAIAAIAAEV